MINFLIRLVKKSPFLYNLEKKINRLLKRNTAAPKREKYITYYCYIMKNLNELDAIKENYKNLQKYNTKLFILINNPSYNIIINKIIRENPDICFADLDYFKKYQAKLSNYRMMWLNYTDKDSILLNYLA